MRNILLLLFFVLPAFVISTIGLIDAAAQPVQTIRGLVTDRDTNQPLIGVTVILAGSDPVMGTSTNPDGVFVLANVPVGRQTLRFSYIGFETVIMSELLVSSGRELVLEVKMREVVGGLDEVVVTPELRKDMAMNTMTAGSARLLSMEEAGRYAGGFDDPARLAGAFAGVSASLASNAIVVRGNNPSGLLWRLEGIEIPTPSHFANLLTFGGGGITALSSHLLADSDFFTGAFPAEFGNALSGVFDMRMRNGNNSRHEKTVRAGVMGLDAAAEGPISPAGRATYLFNYRYSTFALLGPLLPEDAGDIRYQNLAFRINLNTGGTGSLSLWGLGAADWSGQTGDPDPGSWVFDQDREDIKSLTRFGAMGLQLRQNIGKTAFLTSSLALSGNRLTHDVDRYTESAVRVPLQRVGFEAGKAALSSNLNIKHTAAFVQVAGFTLSRHFYDLAIRNAAFAGEPLTTVVDDHGVAWQGQAFSQTSFKTGRLTLLAGLHVHYFSLSGDISAEPRAGLTYEMGRVSSLHLAYGRHSKIEHLPLYFAHPDNRNLGFTRADHLVAGYRQLFDTGISLKIEAWYQRLFNVPVTEGSSFSVLNLEADWFIRDRLLNDGSGRNYGLDVTIERYFRRGWYALFSGSVFRSEYRGGDQIWRDTRYNRNYTFAMLGGREWTWSRPSGNRIRSRTFGVNGRINLMGGRRYSPVDVPATMASREVIYDETRAFSRSEPAIVYADLTIEYRTNRRNTSGVWSLQLINLTGHREFYGYRFNLRNGTIERHREAIILPNAGYRLEF